MPLLLSAQMLVSPLEAVFAPEPGPANRALLRTTRAFDTLTPVPVINPTLGNWREELALCARDPRVRVVQSWRKARASNLCAHSMPGRLKYALSPKKPGISTPMPLNR